MALSFGSGGGDQRLKRLENQLKQAQQQITTQKKQLNNQKGGKGGGKHKGGGKGGGKAGGAGSKRRGDFVQQWQASGKAKRAKNNENICFDFNLPVGCTDAAPGQKCPRGWHVCAAKSCQDKMHAHSATSH